jgi:hypothetical protein
MPDDLTSAGRAIVDALAEFRDTLEAGVPIEDHFEVHTLKRPSIPARLWMLWSGADSCWICAVDDPPGGENYLVCLSLKDAIAAAKYQFNTYAIESTPVRVK